MISVTLASQAQKAGEEEEEEVFEVDAQVRCQRSVVGASCPDARIKQQQWSACASNVLPRKGKYTLLVERILIHVPRSRPGNSDYATLRVE